MRANRAGREGRIPVCRSEVTVFLDSRADGSLCVIAAAFCPITETDLGQNVKAVVKFKPKLLSHFH